MKPWVHSLLCVSFVFVCFTTVRSDKTPECTFPKHNIEQNTKLQRAYSMIAPLRGKRYVVDDGSGNYTYNVGICTTAVSQATDLTSVGVLQVEKESTHTKVVVGEFTNANIFAGTDWVYLEYNGGEKYGHHCGQEERRAAIMIVCDPTVASGQEVMAMLEEENEKTSGCYYLFEMNSPDICPAAGASTLSIGSILVIVFFSVLAMYLLFGFLYQRLVLGAKGMEQIPNYSFWQDFGNLQADGCDFVCRRGNRREHTYKGVGDDQLEEVEERDENLLPM